MIAGGIIVAEGLAILVASAAWTAWLMAGDLGIVTYLPPILLVAIAGGTTVLVGVVKGKRRYVLGLLLAVTVVPALNFRTREIGDVGLDWQNGLKLAIWMGMLGICLATILSYSHILRDRVMLAFLCFTGVGIVSSVYSPVPAYSAACALGMLAYLLFTAFVATKCSERDIMRFMCFGLAVYVAAGWAYAVIAPDRAFLVSHDGSEGLRLFGLSSHPNMLGMETACFLCVLIPAAVRGFISRRSAIALIILCAATILATGSRTTAVTVTMTIGLVWVRGRRIPPILFVLPVTGLAAIMLAFSLGFLPRPDELLGFLSRSGDASEILTLTGRTELWGFVWDKILRQPLQGYGFNSAEAVLAQDWYGNADAGYNAHNLILQSLLTVGLAGALPMVAALVLLMWRWFRQQRQTFSTYVVPYLLMVGATEAHIASMPTLLTLNVFLSAAIDAAGNQMSEGHAEAQHSSRIMTGEWMGETAG